MKRLPWHIDPIKYNTVPIILIKLISMIYAGILNKVLREGLAGISFFPPNGRKGHVEEESLFSVISCELISIPLFSILSQNPKDNPSFQWQMSSLPSSNSLWNENLCTVSLRGWEAKQRGRAQRAAMRLFPACVEESFQATWMAGKGGHGGQLSQLDGS